MPSLLSNLKSAREWATPALRSSAFLSKGVLTPEEFVAAGDELTFKCPTWTWEAGDPSRRRGHLPPEKQFLMTRGVPCSERVSSLEGAVAMGAGGLADDGDDGDWLVGRVLTEEERRGREERALEEGFDILDGEGETMAPAAGGAGVENQVAGMSLGGEDEYADMADFEDDAILEDEAVAAAPNIPTENENVVRVRSYDVSITYDKYYRTPRVWLAGHSDDGSGRPLTGEEMMQDVISDYANRTVTIEEHPHVPGPHASIHPCQHGAVMKTIVKNLTKKGDKAGEGGGGPTVEMYIFIFLKFVSSMIPTISYDFTMDVSASTEKGG